MNAMELLKKYFPYSFGAKDVADLVFKIILHLIVGFVAALIIGLLAEIPVLGFIFSLLGGLVDLYALVGIVLLVLDYLKILK